MSKREHVGRVPSLSAPGTLYEITRIGDDLYCECQAFGSWKKRGLPCWHLRVWNSAQQALGKCYQLHGGDGGDGQKLCAPCLLSLLAAMSAAVKKKYVPKPEKKPRVPKERICTCKHGDTEHLLAATTRGVSCCTAPGCGCTEFREKPKRVRKKKLEAVPA